LHNVALEQVNAHGGNGPWDEDLHRIPQAYLETGGEYLVGLLEERIVAMGALLPTGPGEAEVKRMRVEPEFQRRGYGKALLNALLETAKKQGFRQLHLDTTIQQIGAQALYESAGFSRAGTSEADGFTLLHYRMRLE
jgi:ribosomal protein S18 acetylase RimI-like enzyme